MHETDLKLEPNEASDLCSAFGPDVLVRHGWDRACAARDGHVYVLGSQFGKKAGPLAARRSWIARAGAASLAGAAAGGRAELEIAGLRFGLHRAVNDALAAAGIERRDRRGGPRRAADPGLRLDGPLHDPRPRSRPS